ncbi:MAG TPA: cellulase family glycosylhydrolase [Bacteroidota bacterium]|nr:cellulase family glycosylhydrolase [Bacteroidota bacterium]
MNFTRRRFLTASGSLALAAAVSQVKVFAADHPRLRAAVFFDPGFPSGEIPLDTTMLTRALRSWEVQFLDLAGLTSSLRSGKFDLFVNPYGSYFPKEGWTTIHQYLAGGGNWLNLGGTPCLIPVAKETSGWRAEERQTQYHKKLGITQTFTVSGKTISSYRTIGKSFDSSIARGFAADEIYELYVRFTDSIDTPSESGSAGSRDAEMQPIVHGFADETPVAAPIVLIDRLQSAYAGGRWVFANFKGTLESGTIRSLAELAMFGAVRVSAAATFACYRTGEQPSIIVKCARTRGLVRDLLRGKAQIEILDDRGKNVESGSVLLAAEGSAATGEFLLKKNGLRPGLYTIRVHQEVESGGGKHDLICENGFWVYDRALLEGGTALIAGEDYFSRAGEPYIVTGTTYMGSDVHRKFLFEPNPFLWNRDFASMKAAGINMVRTGIWTGWRLFMPEPGSFNESTLRALDAFIHTARKHDIPVIFTLFAFLPETWGGTNAYLDPHSVSAQKEFVSTIARRYGGVNDIIWDLINEPSFCNPQFLWSCRPNYDSCESDAWNAWLRARYPDASGSLDAAKLEEAHRSTPEEALALPTTDEFNDLNVFMVNRPIKVIDYRLFAQDMFAGWVREMTGAIRANGNPAQLITVGQDEGGTGESPTQHFFGNAVDFSCLHNWWLNDDLVWDSVVTKAPGKANLVEETGVMFYEKMGGEAWRTEEEVKNLLERKLAISIGAGGAGFIEWIWNTNPYMKSDNEAAIGLFRVDGTAKPELDPVARFAKFFAANSHLMQGRVQEEVVMVIPHSQVYSTKNFATEATKRCVRTVYSNCRASLRAVSEYRLDTLLKYRLDTSQKIPNLIIIPSPRTLNDAAWGAAKEMAKDGSVVLITGPFDSDDHWLIRRRSEELGHPAALAPVTQEESLMIDGTQHRLSFRGDKLQQIAKAVLSPAARAEVHTIPMGKGFFIWSPIPVELAEETGPTGALYSFAKQKAKKTDPWYAIDDSTNSVLVIPAVFEESVLYTLVSEGDQNAQVGLMHVEPTYGGKDWRPTTKMITVPAQRSALVFVRRKDGEILSTL